MTLSYPSLPGIEVTLRDGGLILPEDSSTESMLIIGAINKVVGAEEGNVPENPVLIRSTEDLLANNFGSFVGDGGTSPTGVNQLSAAWKQAHEGGNRRTYLMGLNPVTGFEVDPEAPTEEEKRKGYFLALHDKLFGILQDFEVDHIVLIGFFADQPTVEIVPSEFDGTGFEGHSLAEIPGLVLEDESSFVGSFAKALADYAEAQTVNNNAVITYIGTTAPADNTLSAIKAKVDELVKLENEYSGHLQVVTGPELGYSVPGLGRRYFTNGVVTYAALVSTLRAESAPTNKPVLGVSSVSHNLSLRQLNSLSAKQYVSFRVKNGNVYVTDGITTAPKFTEGNVTRDSDYIRLSTLRITHAAVNLIREVADPFIGEPNGMPQRNALNAAIRSGLEAMRSAGAISDFRFTIVSSPRDLILGRAKVTLELVPAFEMRKISVDVSLRPMLDGVEQ